VGSRAAGKNPAQGVSQLLKKLGSALLRRWQPGDTEAALGHYQESLAIDRDQHAAYPEGPQTGTLCEELGGAPPPATA